MGHHRLQSAKNVEENEALLEEIEDYKKEKASFSINHLFAVILFLLLSSFDLGHVIATNCSVIDYASWRATLYNLPFRSTFVDFGDFYDRKDRNRIYASTDVVTNIPRVLLQLDSSKPSAVSPLWNERWITDGGMVPFNERRTIVTPSISTLAEFHVMDYGMEKCIVSLALPTLPSTTSTSESSNIRLDVWKSDFDRRLNPHSMTWGRKPARRQHLGSFLVKPNSTQTLEGYYCKSGTYQILEISCDLGPCDIDVAASGQEARGIFVTQEAYD